MLIIDDFGLQPLRPPAPKDFYEIINGRYEKAATLVTSNRALEEWPQLFGDPLLASTGLDRLFHNAHVLVITDPSFRAHLSGPQKLGLSHLSCYGIELTETLTS